MAEVHRQIQNQLEEMLKSFHNELLTQLEQKVELDSRYLSAALKKYQTEQRSKGDALDKCQAELKKLRKKSQGSKNPQKYSDKELQVGLGRHVLGTLPGDTGALGPRLWFGDFSGRLVSGEGAGALVCPQHSPFLVSGERGRSLLMKLGRARLRSPGGFWVVGCPASGSQQDSSPILQPRWVPEGSPPKKQNPEGVFLPVALDSYLGERPQTVTLITL
ncbi:brain-specific angiogenesis inhibitor 1-associated protein 2-like [Pontoporia blainvillei]|uniref:Brain-specific angiogenesis inhibitor 1-associated protein 2-like n=1 Tax=Pontoporia blainvillei TaxID=48723 RepID=A0ABX0SAK7_PONBL|nr:brain-specific angiogenesis inhibitor 1-associated protein 2-like [Pontoporia blainvillei]